jgi:uncharacterized protein involved in exopolysaccharide biosynthesis
MVPSLPARTHGAAPVLLDSEPSLPEYLAPGISLVQVLAIIRAHWRVTAIVTASLLLLLLVLLKVMPRTYSAMATLMVSYELNQGGKEFPIGAVGSYMGTQVEFITSDRVLLPVIRSLNLVADREFTAGFSGDDPIERDVWVLKELRDRLTVTQGRGSQLLYVQADAREPQKAARIANAIVDTYLHEERKLASEPATARAKEYANQLAELQSKVTVAREAVAAFRRRSGLSNIAQGDGADAQALATLEEQLLEAQNTRRIAEAKGTTGALSNDLLALPDVQTLRRELSDQEAELAQLGTTFGPRHPRILQLRSQMNATRAALTREIGAYGDGKSTEIVAGRQLEESLARAVDERRSKLMAVRQQQDQAAKLLLQLESAEAVYKRALDGYDEIMFASDGKQTNVSLISRAVPSVTPTKPPILKYLVVGTLGAFFVGLLAPLLYELWLDRRIRSRDDLERHFGMPVLAELGHRSGRMRRR